MRALSPLDRALFGILVALWVATLVLAVRQVPEGGIGGIFSLSYPETPEGYPGWLDSFGVQFERPSSGLRLGDRLIRVGDADLRGRLGTVGGR